MAQYFDCSIGFYNIIHMSAKFDVNTNFNSILKPINYVQEHLNEDSNYVPKVVMRVNSPLKYLSIWQAFTNEKDQVLLWLHSMRYINFVKKVFKTLRMIKTLRVKWINLKLKRKIVKRRKKFLHFSEKELVMELKKKWWYSCNSFIKEMEIFPNINKGLFTN